MRHPAIGAPIVPVPTKPSCIGRSLVARSSLALQVSHDNRRARSLESRGGDAMLSTAQSRHLGAERIDQWPVLSERGELRAARRRMPRSYAPGSPADFTLRNRDPGVELNGRPIPPMLLDLMLHRGLYPHPEKTRIAGAGRDERFKCRIDPVTASRSRYRRRACRIREPIRATAA